MRGKQSSSSSRLHSSSSGASGRRDGRIRLSAGAVAGFIARALAFYLALFWLWSYAVPTYVDTLIPIANKELQIFNLSSLTQLGPATDLSYHIGVYNKFAAHMEDALFNFRLESIPSHIPMLLALIFATPIAIVHRLRAIALGIPIMILIESNASVMVMVWSYSFLPDQHKFTPFEDSALRDSLVNFLYYLYMGFGAGAVPLLVWIGTCVKPLTTLFSLRFHLAESAYAPAFQPTNRQATPS